MSARLLLGAPLAREIRERTRSASEILQREAGVIPLLATLQAGNDPAANAYQDSITRNVARAGVHHRAVSFPKSATAAGLVAAIRELNEDPAVHGILMLLPLPGLLPVELVLEHLSPLKDVDGVTPENAGRLQLGLPALRPSTPQGGLELLDHYGISLEGKRAVVIGRSNIVGKPMATLMTARNATVTICHRFTTNLEALLREADVVALATGHPGLVHGSMLKPGAVVLDFGINVLGDRIVGDADADSVIAVAGDYTPVPGGCGPVTTMVLARNSVAVAFATLGGENPTWLSELHQELGMAVR